MVAAFDAGDAQHLERDVVGGGDEGDFFEGLGVYRCTAYSYKSWQYKLPGKIFQMHLEQCSRRNLALHTLWLTKQLGLAREIVLLHKSQQFVGLRNYFFCFQFEKKSILQFMHRLL